MSNLLVRGLPQNIHQRIQEIAESENLSVNQLLVRLLIEAVRAEEKEEEEAEKRRKAFRRLKELRDQIRRKYGKQKDSVKIVRQMREERLRKLTGNE